MEKHTHTHRAAACTRTAAARMRTNRPLATLPAKRSAGARRPQPVASRCGPGGPRPAASGTGACARRGGVAAESAGRGGAGGGTGCGWRRGGRRGSGCVGWVGGVRGGGRWVVGIQFKANQNKKQTRAHKPDQTPNTIHTRIPFRIHTNHTTPAPQHTIRTAAPRSPGPAI